MNKQQYIKWVCEISNQEYNGKIPQQIQPQK